MLLSNVKKIMLETTPIDMRKSYDGLAIVIKNILNEDPFSHTAFIFMNKKYNLIKILYWDLNGFCLFQKRLEKGTFRGCKREPSKFLVEVFIK